MMTMRALTGLLVCASLSLAAPVQGDPVSDWNAITLTHVFGDQSSGRR